MGRITLGDELAVRFHSQVHASHYRQTLPVTHVAAFIETGRLRELDSFSFVVEAISIKERVVRCSKFCQRDRVMD